MANDGRLKVSILGCGGSGGVPSISGGWGMCDPDDGRNSRQRSSILIEAYDDLAGQSTCVLVDMSPDLRAQILGVGLSRLDGVIVTHAHADHIGGIDDMREINRALGSAIDVWALPETIKDLKKRFAYCFQSEQGDGLADIWRPVLIDKPVSPLDCFRIGALDIQPFLQDHGVCESLGIRIGSFAYSTDLVHLDEQAFKVLTGVDTWVIAACVDYEGHPTHAGLETVLGWIDRVRPRRAFLTHMTPVMDYQTILSRCPEGVQPAYDGLVIEI